MHRIRAEHHATRQLHAGGPTGDRRLLLYLYRWVREAAAVPVYSSLGVWLNSQPSGDAYPSVARHTSEPSAARKATTAPSSVPT
jgi:hypothetical protein